jgi:hypothetical protein
MLHIFGTVFIVALYAASYRWGAKVFLATLTIVLVLGWLSGVWLVR